MFRNPDGTEAFMYIDGRVVPICGNEYAPETDDCWRDCYYYGSNYFAPGPGCWYRTYNEDNERYEYRSNMGAVWSQEPIKVKDEYGKRHKVDSETEKYFAEKAVEAKRKAESAEAEAEAAKAEAKRTAAVMQSEIDNIREQISGQGSEETAERLERIASSLSELADMFRYGEAFVKKVGDFDPPKRPAP